MTHRGDPTEYVRIEAEVVLRDVQAALYEDVLLERAAIVCTAVSILFRFGTEDITHPR